jgi:metal-responsive CopG/Arc/MetJ family transcriptional regulator
VYRGALRLESILKMFGPKVKIDRALFERIRKVARIAGYSSADEFVRHALEKELAKFEDAASDEEIRKRLKGLGYIS